MTSTTDRTAYNKFTDLPNYSYKIIQHLLNNNETIWRLLYYPDPEAWNTQVSANLTPEEKGALIWKGEGVTSNFRVFLDDGQSDVETEETIRLNVMPYALSPRNRTVADVVILFEIYCHYKINTLSNYTTRVDTVISELLSTLNGEVIESIGAIGRLHFDKAGTGASRMELGGQTPFRGKWILMGNKSAT